MFARRQASGCGEVLNKNNSMFCHRHHHTEPTGKVLTPHEQIVRLIAFCLYRLFDDTHDVDVTRNENEFDTLEITWRGKILIRIFP